MAHTLHRTRFVALIWICFVYFTVKTTCETMHQSALFGHLESPDYPEPYGDNVDRVWNISVPDGFTIDLYFSFFDLEASYDCEFDYVKVSSSKEMATFCGNEQFFEFGTPSDRHMTSLDNNMVVEFHSDYSNEGPFSGFVAHYHATDINECLVNNGGCEQVCHNFVSGYYCSCRLYYQLQPDNHHCKGNLANVTFHSNGTVQRMGFRAKYYVTGRSCPPLYRPSNGWISGSNFTFRYPVTFSCMDGYYINGSTSRSCQADSTWSGFQPTCDIVKCDVPQPISNGEILYYSGRNFSYSNTIGFMCNDYYEMDGSSSSQCGVNGTWTPEPPVCVPICGESSILPRGPPSGRIVGGQGATPGSWPWQVLLGIKAPGYGNLRNTICGGSVLNEEWIMTAANCVTVTDDGSAKYGHIIPTFTVHVSLGLHKRNSPTKHTIVRSVREIIEHPEFDLVTFDSDVALIHLNESIQFNDFIRPICLPPQNTHFEEDDDERVHIPNVADEDTTAVVIGWGQIGEGLGTSNVLQEVYVGVDVPRNLCNAKLDDPVTMNMTCAGPREGGLDSCHGDSGGPLMLRDDTTNRYFTYGTVSWGEGCGREGKFGVYVRIENFVDWMQSKIMVER